MAASYQTHEREVLVEGLALGCLATGVLAITTNCYSLRAAMTYTAATWVEQDRYPALATLDLDAHLWSSSYRVTSEGARAVWTTGRWLAPLLVVDGNCLDPAEADEGWAAELAQWSDMANLFVSRLKESEKRTREQSEFALPLAEGPAYPRRPRNWRPGRASQRPSHALASKPLP